MEPDRLNITLKLDVYTVPLRIDPSKEPIYRQAGKRVQEKFEQYKRAYPEWTAEQIWVYVALAMALNFESDVRDKNIQPILDRVRELNTLIDNELNQK